MLHWLILDFAPIGPVRIDPVHHPWPLTPTDLVLLLLLDPNHRPLSVFLCLYMMLSVEILLVWRTIHISCSDFVIGYKQTPLGLSDCQKQLLLSYRANQRMK